MTLSEQAKEHLRELLKADPLKAISLTNIYSGDVKLCVICTSIWDMNLKKYVKKGWIPTNVYEANLDLIVKWENTKENIDEYTLEVEGHKDSITDFAHTLNEIETDPFMARAYAQRKAWYVEHLQIEKDQLEKYEIKLAESKKEFQPLQKQINKLRNFNYLRENKYL
jgi:hypothetical protein